jgi:hypothetical protein
MNSNGAILIDVLASFFTCLLISTLLIPMLIKISGSTDDANKRITGMHILYEELKKDTIQVAPVEVLIQRKGVDYTFTLQNYSENPTYLEGCIGYVDSRNHQKELCDITPKR